MKNINKRFKVTNKTLNFKVTNKTMLEIRNITKARISSLLLKIFRKYLQLRYKATVFEIHSNKKQNF